VLFYSKTRLSLVGSSVDRPYRFLPANGLFRMSSHVAFELSGSPNASLMVFVIIENRAAPTMGPVSDSPSAESGHTCDFSLNACEMARI
jgi:hypothetical protein